MKSYIEKSLIILLPAILFAACNKQIDAVKPYDKINQSDELSTLPGLLETTNGNYLNLTNTAGSVFGYDLETVSNNIGEFRGNNITMDPVQDIESDFKDAYNYTNSGASQTGFSESFWRGNYQLIVGINITLEGMTAFEKDGYGALSADDKSTFLHAEGENYFLRALAYFNLIRVYGMPYYNNPGSNAGVMLKTTGDPSDIPGRSTVEDTYALIVQDLEQAAALMEGGGDRGNTFANTGAAWALLSKVYLYMGGTFSSPDKNYNGLAVTYADSVINAGSYRLLQGQEYVNMFAPDLDGSLNRSDVADNPEVIFAYDHSATGTGNGAGNLGWFYHYMIYGSHILGGFYPSNSFKALLGNTDLRRNFLYLNPATGKTETSKYLVLPDAWTESAPYIYLRLAEVYLSRAEAEVKTGDNGDALNDLNIVHTRAGLPALTGLTGGDLFNAILNERTELAFEGNNSFDDFRNGLPMTRPAQDTNGQPFVVQPTDPKVVMRIPFDEITTNPKLKQNDQ